jgi:hypothetical protein
MANSIHSGTRVNHTSLIHNIIASYISENKQPIMIHGGPGLGKSDCVRDAALQLSYLLDDENFQVVDLRLLLLEPSDLRGLPFVNSEDKCNWAIAPFLPTDPDSKGILFLDELPAASQQLMKAAYQLVLDRAVGEYTLPDGWLVVAAGNRVSDRGGVNVMPTPLKNRFLHLELDEESIFPSWKEYAYNNNIHDGVLGFLNFRSSALYVFTTDHNAFPTPRSWSAVSNMLHAMDKFKLPSYEGDIENLRQQLIRQRAEGLIGAGVASELHTFLSLRNKLPRLEQILRGENLEKLELTNTSVIWAITTMLCSYFLNNYKSKISFKATEVLNVMKFVNLIPAAEIKASALRELNLQGKLNTYLTASKTPEEVKNEYNKLYKELKSHM